MPWKIKSESNIERVWVEVDAQGFEIRGTARIEPIISTPELVDQHVVPASVAEPAATMVQAPQVEVPAPVPEIAVTPATYIAPAYVPPVQPVPVWIEPPPITPQLALTPTPIMPLYEAPPVSAQPAPPAVDVQLPQGWSIAPELPVTQDVTPSPAPPTRRNFAWPTLHPSDAAVGGFVAGIIVGAFQLLAHFL